MTTINASDQEVQERYEKRARIVADLEASRRAWEILNKQEGGKYAKVLETIDMSIEVMKVPTAPRPIDRKAFPYALAWTTVMLILVILAVIR